VTSKSSKTTSKEQIFSSAQYLFSKEGFAAVSVRDIAAHAKVNLALVNYHFKNKENLYLNCISHFAEKHISNIKEVLSGPESKNDFLTRLKIFISQMIRMVNTDKSVIRMIAREIQDTSRSDFHIQIMNQLHPFFDCIVNFFTQAQKNKILSAKLDPEKSAMIMMGAIMHPINCEGSLNIKMKVKIEDTKFQNSYIEQLYLMICSGVLNENKN
jgi:AcrR family transcriptional regulator